jgi:hypothetical protein
MEDLNDIDINEEGVGLMEDGDISKLLAGEEGEELDSLLEMSFSLVGSVGDEQLPVNNNFSYMKTHTFSQMVLVLRSRVIDIDSKQTQTTSNRKARFILIVE